MTPVTFSSNLRRPSKHILIADGEERNDEGGDNGRQEAGEGRVLFEELKSQRRRPFQMVALTGDVL